ncbi:hypothetical protein BHM03_00045267 [Ensete ventricosum]|uniref:Transmembrane protein n=1 Tax=Ensete ventricosum TaxID=4639 RepID=A0A445MKX1_ENSVE|nr:hypothetical protein BHM03_00045267 [Ensete ventricosum]
MCSDFCSENMQSGRGGSGDFFGFGDLFAGSGGFSRPGGLISSFFGGRNPFDDPFFTQPFGSLMGPSMFGPSMFGPSMFADRGSLLGETSRAGFLEQTPYVNKSKGPIIQELSDDDNGEGEETDKEQKENPRKHSRTSKQPYVEDPDEVVEGVYAYLLVPFFIVVVGFKMIIFLCGARFLSRFVFAANKRKRMQYVNNFNQSNRMQSHSHSITFQSSTVSCGGPNGAYYTSSTTRRMGDDGVSNQD